jgi:hypothetical protein
MLGGAVRLTINAPARLSFARRRGPRAADRSLPVREHRGVFPPGFLLPAGPVTILARGIVAIICAAFV